ncbi:MAG: hypothetical protein ACOY0T_37420 [Myxococcota bacterium]
MPSFREMLSPPELGESRIRLTLSPDTPAPTEGAPALVDIDYSKAAPEGITLPIVCSVAGPSGRKVLNVVFTRMLPTQIEWSPEEGGPHLVRIAEMFHNRWFGALVVDVIGDEQGDDR